MGGLPHGRLIWMPRYFLADIIDEERFAIKANEARHLQRVLRKGPGDCIEISDGNGRFFRGTILTADFDGMTGRIDQQLQRDAEPGVRLVLCQSLPKGDKMDEIVRKGTEIGITTFLPFISRRCVCRPDYKDAEKKRGRWQRIAEEASKQAGRSMIPEVLPLTDWAGVRRAVADHPGLMAWEAEDTKGVRGALAAMEPKALNIIIGPEGGFDPAEVEDCRAQGVIPVSLGPRILRTETAGPILAALALYEFGEMEPRIKEEI